MDLQVCKTGICNVDKLCEIRYRHIIKWNEVMSMKSLVVDDYPINRIILHKYLSVLGAVHDAEEGLKGIELFEQALRTTAPYDLVCLDIAMPGLNGFEVLTRMRELESDYGISKPAIVIMVSAHSGKENIMTAVERADGFIVKPITQEILYSKLRSLNFDVPHVKTQAGTEYEKKLAANNEELLNCASHEIEKKKTALKIDAEIHDDLLRSAAEMVLQRKLTNDNVEEMPEMVEEMNISGGEWINKEIRFDGDVNIDGDLEGGQRIIATRDVKINGILGQSCIKSEGNVEVHRFHGAEKGEIHAAGDVRADAVYNATIESDKNITIAQECVGSTILCLGSVNAGTITGGKCISLGDIWVERAGASHDVTTVLAAGTDYRLEAILASLQNDSKQVKEEIRRMEQLVGPMLAQIESADEISASLGDRHKICLEKLLEIRAQKKRIDVDIFETKKSMSKTASASIHVSGMLYKGVVVQIGEMRAVVSNNMTGITHVCYDARKGRILFNQE